MQGWLSAVLFAILCLPFYPIQAANDDADKLARDNYYRQARDYLKSIIYTPEAVENWLAGKIVYGEQYHPVLGWIHNDRIIQHGVGQSYSVYHYESNGARRIIAYRDEPCRINTYGDSFTSCEQVNDGETWQEVLANHLGEPVRNYGIGGYSVYQSYRRMLLEEEQTSAPYIIFNIFDDDHYRNLTGWRNIRLGLTVQTRPDVSSPTLPYIKTNPAKNEFIECDNPCSVPESVYNLCDEDWLFDHFKDNFVLKLIIAGRNLGQNQAERSYPVIQELAREHGLEMTVDSPELLKKAVDHVFTNAGLYASKRIVDLVEKYAAERGKKVLYVLSFQNITVKKAVETGTRFDQDFVDYLESHNLPYVDLLKAHLTDYAQYKVSFDDYAGQYWIGHYSPRGNFFEAEAIRNKLVEMLDPKPDPYRAPSQAYYESPWEGRKTEPRRSRSIESVPPK